MSGNDCWNKHVFSLWQKSVREADDWISGGRLFQKIDAATGNERRPTVARLYAGTCSRCDEDERIWWQPGRPANNPNFQVENLAFNGGGGASRDSVFAQCAYTVSHTAQQNLKTQWGGGLFYLTPLTFLFPAGYASAPDCDGKFNTYASSTCVLMFRSVGSSPSTGWTWCRAIERDCHSTELDWARLARRTSHQLHRRVHYAHVCRF